MTPRPSHLSAIGTLAEPFSLSEFRGALGRVGHPDVDATDDGLHDILRTGLGYRAFRDSTGNNLYRSNPKPTPVHGRRPLGLRATIIIAVVLHALICIGVGVAAFGLGAGLPR